MISCAASRLIALPPRRNAGKCSTYGSICALLLLAIVCAALPLRAASAAASDIPSVTALPYTIVDDSGETISLKQPARRIIALYGAFNEILLGMGLHDSIIARTSADAAMPELAHLPGIGTHMRPSLEMTAALGPDLVLQMGGRNEAMESVHALRRLGIRVAFFRVASFEDLFALIHKLGVLTGEERAAAALEDSLRERLRVLDAALESARETPSVFFELRYPGLIGAGPGSITTDIIARAGGSNCLAPAADGMNADDQRVVRVSEEELIRNNPDWYVIQQGPMNKNPQPVGERQHYGALSAVRNGRVLTVDETM
ncbi:ABC transporter substrate-binding protein, partial [Desulfovibrio sp. OttesenSCG-928-I05]|nr:ABC transporter substrate-binding protein [Desulfovibrio sp. OttesenSCG-928-I05]